MTTIDRLSPLVQIVDDDQGVREALARLVHSVGLRAVTFDDPLTFLDRMDKDAMGVIVMDIRMPGMGGLSVLDRLRAAGVTIPVVVMTGHATVDLCRRAFKGGAVEFLEKPVDDEQLLEALQAAIRLHAATAERLRADGAVRERYAQLSARERQVATAIIDGKTNKVIARDLGLSPRTVETHRAHVFDKLGVESLAELVRVYAGVLEEHER